jgi:hypothetical protein
MLAGAPTSIETICAGTRLLAVRSTHHQRRLLAASTNCLWPNV